MVIDLDFLEQLYLNEKVSTAASKKDKKRVDLDVRPEGPWFKNYDYGDPDKATETSPGTGLYSGKMDKYKSVKDFIDQKRKRKHELRRKAMLVILETLISANKME